MTQFIIHIGPHKTGTTYLQLTLDALRNVLLERGICVPSIWNAAPRLPSHMQLAWALRGRDLSTVRNQLREILARQPRYVVVSCEALARLDQPQIRQLHELFGSAPAQVVYYVRRWPERLPSLWQETVKFGHATAFPEFLANQLTQVVNSEWRDAEAIDRFAAVFGATQIKLVSYSHLADSGIDIASHFLTTILGLSGIEVPAAGQRPNRSLPILDAELIRALNVIHSRCEGETSPALRNWFLAKRSGLVPGFVLDAMRTCLGTIRLDEATSMSLLVLQDLLARYSSCIVPPRCATGLHELRAIDVVHVRQDYLLEPTVSEALREIYASYCRTL